MNRITALVLVALVLAIIYATAMTVLLAHHEPDPYVEISRLQFCRNLSRVARDHASDAAVHLDENLEPRDAWGTYLLRERRVIELAVNACLPGLDLSPFEPGERTRYLQWVEAVELMLYRTSR